MEAKNDNKCKQAYRSVIVLWTKNPLLISGRYTIAYHEKYFRTLAARIGCYTEKCTISLLDLYKNMLRNVKPLGISAPQKEEQIELAQEFSVIAQEYGFYLDTCAEEADFAEWRGLQWQIYV